MGKLSKSNFMRFWFPAIVYSGIIFIASSVPNVRTPLAEFGFDKMLHILEYVPFGFLVNRALSGTWSIQSGRAVGFWVILLTFLYAASDEFHQSFVPGRSLSSLDLTADTIGGAVGGCLYALVNSIRNR